jgi:DNA invertase Pin-like site-specific DNA recombinase
MIFGYARMIENESDLKIQLDEIRDFKAEVIYEDKSQDQKKLNEILSQLKKGDTLVIWRLDRLCRTIYQLFSLIVNFKRNGIYFISIQEKIDTSISEDFENILFALVKMESFNTSIRTNTGITAAKKQGRTNGRKPIDQKQIEEAIRLYNQNELSLTEIAKTTGVSKASLYKYIHLKNIEMVDNLIDKKTDKP